MFYLFSATASAGKITPFNELIDMIEARRSFILSNLMNLRCQVNGKDRIVVLNAGLIYWQKGIVLKSMQTFN